MLYYNYHSIIIAILSLISVICSPSPGVAELEKMAESLSQEVCCVSDLLVRLLHMRDKRVSRLLKHFDKLTTILRNYAEENGI